jgi:hypothetical protein
MQSDDLARIRLVLTECCREAFGSLLLGVKRDTFTRA